MDILNNLKKWALEQVIQAEKNLPGKTGAEKRAAVIKKLDDMIQLPAYLEWMDDIIIARAVDYAVAALNKLTGHNFGGLELTQEQEQEITKEIPDLEGEAR